MLEKPYKGNENYIFISYSHKNTKEVQSFIEQLQQHGYNIWYDEGIDPGTEWDENIASHIRDSSYFIAYVTNEYVDSQNCKDELTYARDLNKERLLVYGENVELPEGMKMRMNRLQAIFKYKYKNENDFYTKVFETQGLEICRSGNVSMKDVTATEIVQTQKKTMNTKVMLIAACLVLVLLIGVFALSNSKNKTDTTTSADSSEQSESVEINLDDAVTNDIHSSQGDIISLKSIEVKRKNGDYIEASFVVVNNSDQVLKDVNLNGEDYDKNGNMLEEISPGGENSIQPGNEFTIESAWYVADEGTDYTDADVETVKITGYFYSTDEGFFEYDFESEIEPFSIWEPNVYTFD